MDRQAYDTKVTDMLSDPSSYKSVAKDLTAALQWRMNALLLSPKRSDHISEQLYNRLRYPAGRIPLLNRELGTLPHIYKTFIVHTPQTVN